MKLGILGGAEIAYRRFLPALQKCGKMEYVGVASHSSEKARLFRETFGGESYASYDALLSDESIEAVYVPLPPALHYEWGKKVLQAGKHLLMEKPFTTTLEETKELLALAEKQKLVVHENYMFLYHSQLAKIKELIANGELGELRLVRMAFGFPMRSKNDFRYNHALGGGALLDCGGYPIRLAAELLGENVRVVQADLTQPQGYEVDLFGSAVLQNEAGLCAQVSFGMDNTYQCQLEIWGSKNTLIAPRIFTAGADYEPLLILRSSADEKTLTLPVDDQFLHSAEVFAAAIEKRETGFDQKIYQQAWLVKETRRLAYENH